MSHQNPVVRTKVRLFSRCLSKSRIVPYNAHFDGLLSSPNFDTEPAQLQSAHFDEETGRIHCYRGERHLGYVICDGSYSHMLFKRFIDSGVGPENAAANVMTRFYPVNLALPR